MSSIFNFSLNRNSLKILTAQETFSALPGQSRDLEKVLTIPSGAAVQQVITTVKTGYARTVNITERGFSVSGTQLTVGFCLGCTDTAQRDVTVFITCLYK